MSQVWTSFYCSPSLRQLIQLLKVLT
uniref:Uncharacterized protein n=1 Tax=Anguilla anguilla TaxID=7936 RepID=A0A0E9V8V5_ANGAN